MEHPDEDVQAAIVRLSDALCQWERATSRRSVLILREEGGFEYRAADGKPDISPDVTDAMLWAMIERGGGDAR